MTTRILTLTHRQIQEGSRMSRLNKIMVSCLTFMLTLWASIVYVTPAQASPAPFCDPTDPTQMILEFAVQGGETGFTVELPVNNFQGDVDWGYGGLTGSYSGTIPTFGFAGTPGTVFHVCLKGTADSFGTPDDPSGPYFNPSQYQWVGVHNVTR